MFKVSHPKEILEAGDFLNKSNELYTYMLEFQKSQYKNFWMPNGILRTKEELNKILESMDLEGPQSALFFLLAYELSQIILKLNPNALTEEEFLPKFQYSLENGTVRII